MAPPAQKRLFSRRERDEITALYLHLDSVSFPGNFSSDCPRWPLLSSSIFSVNSLYSFINSGGGSSNKKAEQINKTARELGLRNMVQDADDDAVGDNFPPDI